MDADVRVNQLVNAIREKIDLSGQLGDEFVYASLPLCAIDSIFSIQAHYDRITRPTVQRWCEAHGWAIKRGQGAEHTVDEFLALCAPMTPEGLADKVFKNRQRTSARSGILKADAVVRFVNVLAQEGIQTFADMADSRKILSLEPKLREVYGQASGITTEYFFMLAGATQHIKADTMVCRFVGDQLSMNGPASSEQARMLMKAAARRLFVEPSNLDYAVWKYQRTQPFRSARASKASREPA